MQGGLAYDGAQLSVSHRRRPITTPGATDKKTPAHESKPAAPKKERLFGSIRFPDKVLKSGDSWTGTLTITQAADLQGITLHYDSTLAGFEMYQGFPCARVETNFSYDGPLPGIEAQARKQLPAGSKIKATGQLTGSETSYFALDRGWSLNDQMKLTVAVNVSLTAKGQAVEVGGTINIDRHEDVTGYPAYDPSLVPKVAAASGAP